MGENLQKICPYCGSKKVVPIIYGMPGAELEEQEQRGELILGGCVITDNEPELYCKDCKEEIYKKK